MLFINWYFVILLISAHGAIQALIVKSAFFAIRRTIPRLLVFVSSIIFFIDCIIVLIFLKIKQNNFISGSRHFETVIDSLNIGDPFFLIGHDIELIKIFLFVLSGPLILSIFYSKNISIQKDLRISTVLGLVFGIISYLMRLIGLSLVL